MKHSLPIDKNVILQAYSDAQEMCARLASYGTALFIQEIGYGDYLEKADELAHRDLLVLAISLRRLAELTSTETLLKELTLPAKPNPNWNSTVGKSSIKEAGIDCWSLFGKIIHCREYFAFKDDLKLSIFSRKQSHMSDQHLDTVDTTKDIRALCVIKSDNGELALFALPDLIQRSVDYLDELKEFLIDKKILPLW